MATDEGAETHKILVTPLHPRPSNIRTYSRKKSSSKLPSLKPSQKQYPAKPPQQVQLNLRVTKRLSDVSKTAEPTLSNRIEVVIPDPESARFDPHDYDDAYVGEEEDEDVGDNVGGNEHVAEYEEAPESEGDDEIPNTTRRKSKTAFVPPGAGEDVYNIPDDSPEDLPSNNLPQVVPAKSEGQKKNQVQVVIPSKTPHFTQHMTRGRPPGNGPRRPHLIFNKLPARNRFKKLPQTARGTRQTSTLRSRPGDGFSEEEIRRSGLVLRRSSKPNTTDSRACEPNIPRGPPLPKLKGDKRRADLEDSSCEIRPGKKTKSTQEQPTVVPKQTSQSTQLQSTPHLTVPTQILMPPLRQHSVPKARVIIHPPTSEEDEDEDLTYDPDDEIIIPKSSDPVVPPDAEEEEQENSGYETYISETSTGGQRSSSVPPEPTVQPEEENNGATDGVDAGVQVTQGLERRRGLKRSITQ
ncbi:hypothetical protein QBC41DRAFT_267776 [Cercophora samala]|uniref:Uncharacterized protein n=1 Tax=Cercophora samala TaxID=330535 RepID=A0AA39ZKG5_9PEZI|nr:hypothetical protein QBC41DRAFT_267776 [Cercophora samala]